MNRVLHAILLLTLLGIITPLANANPGVLEQEVYNIGDTVTIHIPVGEATSVTVIAPDARYKLLDLLESTVDFVPRTEGTHQISITGIDGETLVTAEFLVAPPIVPNISTVLLDPIDPHAGTNVTLRIIPQPVGDVDVEIVTINGKFRYHGPWYDAPFVPRDAGTHEVIVSQNGAVIARASFDVAPAKAKLISATKASYGPGEQVEIIATEGIGTAWTLLITSGERTVKYTGTERTVRFTPLDGGMQVIQAIGKDGNILDEVVVDASFDAAPIATTGFLLEDRTGKQRNVPATFMEGPRGMSVVLEKPISAVRRIEFRGMESGFLKRLRIEDVAPAAVDGQESVQSYAIDPTVVAFTDATITATAKGTELYKCTQYDYRTGVCSGPWSFVRHITPGEDYRFLLTPEDPLYSELNTTFRCSCANSVNGNEGTLTCSVYCAYTINIPANATDYYLQSLRYNATITITTTGNVITGSHSAFFDHDTNRTNADDVIVNSSRSTAIATTTVIWTNSSIPSSGARSFTQNDCSSWPNYCLYYVFLNGTYTYDSPGSSNRDYAINISINSVNYTINYTVPGPFSVVLNTPANGAYNASRSVLFNYTPSSPNPLANCSLFTNATGWSILNTTTSITNGTGNLITGNFTADGVYLWNIRCANNVTNATTFGSSNRTITIDTAPPVVFQVHPPNASTNTSTNVIVFTYNVTDLTPILNCSLYIDGVLEKSDTSVISGTNQTISNSITNGLHNWSIGCYDTLGQYSETENRLINVSVAGSILTGLWFETDSQSCATFPCEINAAQQTDGTANGITGAIASSTTSNIVQALSDFIGSNGGFINSGSTVTFSTFFQTVSGGNVNVLWYLYKRNETADAVVCNNTAGTGASSGAASSVSCTITGSDIRIQAEDQFYYRIDIQNTHPSQSRTINHTIDHASSFFNLTNFTQVGFLSGLLVHPTTSATILQGTNITFACNATCSGGSCINLAIAVQTNRTGTWTNISTTGNLTPNGTETNPHGFGTVFNTTVNTSFILNGSSPGTTYVRCLAADRYTSDETDAVAITITNNQAPTVALNAPANNSWQNRSTINFTYTPTSLGTYTNCSLYIDGVFNQTNSTPILNNQPNNFTATLDEARYNWSVTCVDISELSGSSDTRYFDVDTRRPYNITLHTPENATVSTSPSIMFNWTATDERAPNMTCSLVINNTINTTVTVLNATPYNVTVSGFRIGTYNWSVNCSDLAGNRNQTETRIFNISDAPPTANLITPANNSGYNSTTVVFIYNATDNFLLTNCSLYVGGLYNQSNQTPLQNGLNNFTAGFTEGGPFNWSVACTDDANNNVSTSNFTFRVDITLPNVSLNAPVNNSQWNTSSISFTYTAIDNNNGLTCPIMIDGVVNVTSFPVNATPQLETVNGFIDGNHLWNVTCYDIANNSNVSDTWNFSVSQYPTIAHGNPANGTHVNGATVFLFYTPTDNDALRNCSLFINGTYNQTNVSVITSDTQTNFSLVNPADGSYLWAVECYDDGVFGLYNITENRTFTVDNTLPSIMLHNPPNSTIVNQSSIYFNWTASDNFATALLCNLTINQSVNVSNIVSPNGAPANITVTGFRSGSYNWSVACIDNATNRNVSVTFNFTVIIPPAVNLTSPANDTYSLSTGVTFSYLPFDGSGAFPNCTLYINGVANQTNSTITPEIQNNFTLANLPDGRYDWNVTCIDSNLLEGQGIGRSYYVDTQGPYNITLLNPQNNSLLTRNNVSFTFIEYDALSPNTTCTIWLTDIGGQFPLATNLNVTNGTNYTHYSIQPDGNYSWNVSCVDIAGNINVSVVHNFTIEAPPNVTLVLPPNATWNNTGNITFVYYPDDDVQIKNCTLYFNGIANLSDAIIQNRENNTFPVTGMSSGVYNWTVGCFDQDDNFYAPPNETLYVDRDRPHINLTAPADTATLLSSYVLFNYTPFDNLAINLTCDLTINNTVNNTAIIGNGLPYNVTIGEFTDGLFLWNVTCADNAQNTNTSITRNFTIAEAPKVSLFAPANGTRTANTTINITYRPDDNSGSVAYCTVVLNGVVNATNSTPVTIEQENNISAQDLYHNTWLWDVNCTDPSGNSGGNGTALIYHVDRLGPNITLYDPADALTFNTNNITFNWTATDFNTSVSITCNLSVSNQTNNPIIVSGLSNVSGGTFHTSVPGLSDGSHSWNVTCIDDLGNTNISATRTFIINQPDLVLNSSARIGFSNTNPDGGEQINISANVTNIGGLDATNANVTFWDGEPGAGGTYIGSMILTVPANQSRLFWTLWNITDGYHIIYARADPESIISELNETNNNATRNISYIKVNITYPLNNTYTSDTTPQIDFNITDFTQNNLTYRIFVDNVYNGQSGNVTPDSNTSITLNALTDGVRVVRVEATDSLGRSKNSTQWYFRIDTTAPSTNFTTVNATWFNTQNVTIFFNITDAFSTSINWTAYLDGVLNQSNSTTNGTGANATFFGVSEGAHTVIIQSTDELGNTGNSTAFTFYVDVTPPIPNITTPNASWFNTSAPNITLRITDNLDTILNWTFYVDGIVNTNGSALNATNTSGLLSGVSEGTHTIILQAYDNAGNIANSTPVTITVDLTQPNVTLLYPPNASNFSTTSVELNFTANDNLAQTLICNLTLDSTVVQQYNLTNGTNATYLATNLAGGWHSWSAVCIDNATNRATSATWQFYINLPDFTVVAVNLSNSTPVENQNITVNATFTNIGDINYTGNVTVQFWIGDPDNGGSQIAANITLNGLDIGETVVASVNYTAAIGINTIFAIIDPPTLTNGSVAEKNETNNRFNVSFWVGLFEVFAGGSGNELRIADGIAVPAYTWNQTEVTGSNVFVADSESSISFTSLHAIRLNITNGTSVGANDFEEIDARINATTLNDSVNRTFTVGGEPIGYRNITAFRRAITQIPTINSTNTTSFRTGILWDAADANPGFYNGSQDIVFVTVMNQSQVGRYGTYDYEIAIPATLRQYIAGGTSVTFYTELI